MGWADTSGEFVGVCRHSALLKRYRCIWAICGTGLWLDVAWYAIFSYAAPSMQRELGYSDKEYGNLFSSFSAGTMIGAAVWGILVDILGRWRRILYRSMPLNMFGIGRRVAFLGTCLIAGAFGICLGALSSYPSVLVFVALIGFGVGGNLPVDSTSECPQYDIFSSLNYVSSKLPWNTCQR